MKSAAKVRPKRHAGFQPYLDGLKSWFDMEDTSSVIDLTVPNAANDNFLEEDEPLVLDGSDTEFRFRPSVSELLAASRFTEREYRNARRAAALESDARIEIGGLRLSLFYLDHFETTERAWATHKGEIVAYRTGGGTWSRPAEELAGPRGARPRSSGGSWASDLGRTPGRRVTTTTLRRKIHPPINWSELPSVRGEVPFAEARSNAGLPPSAAVRPALPYAPPPSDLFLSGRVASTGRPPMLRFTTHLDKMIASEERSLVSSLVGPHHSAVLDASLHARSFRDLGASGGRTGKAAERAGKRLLLDAAAAIQRALVRAGAS